MRTNRVSLTLEVLISTPDLAGLLAKSLKPDNKDLPKGLKLEVDVTTGGFLRILIEADDVGMVLNTINDIFTCLQPTMKLLGKS